MLNRLSDQNDSLNRFRNLIERDFLRRVIKPARFLSTEWRGVTDHSAQDKSKPLAVIAHARGYESAVNDPLSVAVSESLANCEMFRVGYSYSLGREPQEILDSIGAEQFITPQLIPLRLANCIFFPLSDSSDIFPFFARLAKAGLGSSSKTGEGNSGDSAKIIAVIAISDSGTSSALTALFDKVIHIDNLGPALKSADSVESFLSSNAETKTDCNCFIPSQPPGPVIETSIPRARFRFLDSSDQFDSAAGIGESLALGLKNSGQTELQLENCKALTGAGTLAESVDQLCSYVEPRRYAIALESTRLDQLTARLIGALGRFRRVRVDIALPTMSQTIAQALGCQLDLPKLIRILSALQKLDKIQIQLSPKLGWPADTEAEREETRSLIRSLSSSLNPRVGLRVKFTQFTPECLPETEKFRLMQPDLLLQSFNSINSRKARGVSLTLADQFQPIVSTLLERGAWSDRESIIQFSTEAGEEKNSADKQKFKLLNRYEKSFEGTTVTNIFNGAEESAAVDSDDIQALADSSSDSFGRGRRRAGSAPGYAPTRTRVRFTWAKTGLGRFLSHLDNIRAIEAALIRTEAPVSYTQGVRPRMKLSFGPPLPLGFTSQCELFDAQFDSSLSPDQFEKLRKSTPDCYQIIRSESIYTSAVSILGQIKAATYIVRLPAEDEIADKLAASLVVETLSHTRQTKSGEKTVDLRPGIHFARIVTEEDSELNHLLKEEDQTNSDLSAIKLTLALSDRFYVRPEEYLKAAGIIPPEGCADLSIHRKSFIFSDTVRNNRQENLLETQKL